MSEPFSRPTDPPVRGFLHTPTAPSGRALVLSHGAGSNASAPLLIALADTFADTGFTVLRCDLPYRQLRSWGPPGPADAARDRAGLKNAVLCVKEILGGDFPAQNQSANPGQAAPPNAVFVGWESIPPGSVFLGGHSYGGRQSSMLCSELTTQPSSTDEKNLVAGLLLLSYPLHPPRKPEQQRTQHLPDLRTPALFISGTRDPFGSIAELSQALKMIPARTKLLAIEGAGHDLGFKGKTTDSKLPATILEEFQKFFS